MGILRNLFSAGNAMSARLNIAGIQGRLEYNLKKDEPSSKRIDELIKELCTAAWGVNFLATFFTRHGYTFEDYVAIYSALVYAHAHFNKIDRENLIATTILIDQYAKFAPVFDQMSQKVIGKPKQERLDDMISFLLSAIDEVIHGL